ncbi:alpha/beta fold hydrolase [Massilia soli]|uniref:Alpha/beta hydrolase n=1 Tax=Massilia soli TaxID=2792854 RepID=A0ABS7ST97_9BURK|nr:alpha/beta hydrolase [Massilia soli]MBZ2209171.1 alpha/beta hydrolase [Massilia soli]
MLNGYAQLGNGPHKVMVMAGWFGVADDWRTTLEALDGEAFTFVLFDYRGYGLSKQLDGEYTFEEVAGDVVRLADHLGWKRFSLIGHSMGGAAIQRVMLAAPHRIDRMVAVTAVPACSSRMDAARLEMFESAVGDRARREFIINFSTGSRLPKTWIAQKAERSVASSTSAAFGGYLKQWATVDFSPLVQNNPTRVKVIVGEFDPTLTAEVMLATWLAWYPNAELETMANSGHYPMHETPLALAAAIQDFLQRP